jgi:Raf kinase inhibitor-like YbhB/YbcL family protein
MKLTSTSIEGGKPIPGDFAFCIPDPDSRITFGGNRNPAFAWDELPERTLSLVLVCHDPDVPSLPDDVNQEGRTVPADLARVDFYHWILVDVPPAGVIEEGAYSDCVTAKGKAGPSAPGGARQGINNYTQWFGDDPEMGGSYFGYDGPCPPWNDSIVHHYHFTLYALDIDRCPVEGNFTAPDVLEAIEGHVLAEASMMGTYSLNPEIPA